MLQVARDVVDTLTLGKRATMKALLYARRVLAWSDARHALNRLYVDDYCVWLQSVSRTRLKRLAEHLDGIVTTLALPHLDLPLDYSDDDEDVEEDKEQEETPVLREQR